ncbi:MAG: response regulator transcription factor [Nocardioides sp.]|jgi:two-component system response regulator MprA
MKLLVIEDDPALAASLARSMRFEGYDLEVAASGEAGLAHLTAVGADCVVLDVGLPGISGLELTRRLRRDGNQTPILMLTARQLTGDRVAGLDAGADDYLVKPFELEELLARIRALLRRSNAVEDHGELVLADLRMDTRGLEAWRGDREVVLTRTEWQLLEYLMSHPRQVLTRTQLWQHVWGYDFDPGSNTLEVFIGYLRRKTEAGGEPRLIHTVRGTGYVLREPRVG